MLVTIKATIKDFGSITWPPVEIIDNAPTTMASVIEKAKVDTRKAFGCNWSPAVALAIVCK